MGEIADALRRARHLQTERAAAPATSPAVRSAEHFESARETLGSAPPRAAPGSVVDSLSPTNPAIAAEDSSALEACRQVALRLRAVLEARAARSVAVVSGLRAEGKTTVLCNLGLAMASLSRNRDVALVDLDLRKPSLARVLDVRAAASIQNVLEGRASLDTARISVGRPPIDLYLSMEPHASAHELLALPTFARMISDLESRYAVVLIDTSPALLTPDATLILRHVPFCIPIARSGQTRTRSFEQLIELLPRQKILGELINATRATDRYYDAYYAHTEVEGADTDAHESRAPRSNASRRR
jgi:tyrosine-protein kinase